MTYPMQQHSSTMLPIIKGMKCMECYTLLYSKTFSRIATHSLSCDVYSTSFGVYVVMYIQNLFLYISYPAIDILFAPESRSLYSFSRYNIYADFLVALDPPFLK